MSAMRRLAAVVTTVLLILLLTESAHAAPLPDPGTLANLGAARQVIVVTSTSWSTSYATLRAYDVADDGSWRAAVPAAPARIGANGFSAGASRLQNTNTTPTGTYAIPRAMGYWGAPGTRLPYYQFDSDDWWSYDPRDPSTYNVLQYGRPAGAPWRTGWAERLRSYAPQQYGYVAVLDFNLPRSARYRPTDGSYVGTTPVDTRRGGGIFLHVTNGRATAGCVAVEFSVMQQLLRWLDPAKEPVIVMGPAAVIDQM